MVCISSMQLTVTGFLILVHSRIFHRDANTIHLKRIVEMIMIGGFCSMDLQLIVLGYARGLALDVRLNILEMVIMQLRNAHTVVRTVAKHKSKRFAHGMQ